MSCVSVSIIPSPGLFSRSKRSSRNCSCSPSTCPAAIPHGQIVPLPRCAPAGGAALPHLPALPGTAAPGTVPELSLSHTHARHRAQSGAAGDTRTGAALVPGWLLARPQGTGALRALRYPCKCPHCWEQVAPVAHPGHRRSHPGFLAQARQGDLGNAEGSMAVSSSPGRALAVPSPLALPPEMCW